MSQYYQAKYEVIKILRWYSTCASPPVKRTIPKCEERRCQREQAAGAVGWAGAGLRGVAEGHGDWGGSGMAKREAVKSGDGDGHQFILRH